MAAKNSNQTVEPKKQAKTPDQTPTPAAVPHQNHEMRKQNDEKTLREAE